MRKITANIIYPVSSPPIKDAYVVIDNNEEIVDIVNYNRNSKEVAGLEYYSGVLIPGFVNAHCHLELSHLKGKIEEGRGLSHFIKQVQTNRKESQKTVEKSMQNTLRYLWSRGINGLGDVANSDIGINIKGSSPILTHNFIELFNEDNKSINETVEYGKYIEQEYSTNNQKCSLSPHSTYGTSVELLKQINKSVDNRQITSLHFLESKHEIEPDDNKVIDYLLELSSFDKILLVHNLFLNEKIFKKIKNNMELFNKLFWVVSPNSNLYIKSELPQIGDFYKWGMQLCIGTDSFASNHQLSILEEMKIITKYFSEIPFETLLKWSTLNGAKALNMESILGSFSVGKKPGVLLLSNFDFKKRQLTQNSEITRLV